ncbi:MAG TPA: hypothetical protein VL404_07625 [Candidatus Eisenbacteria bacterium]|jgi:hypothetical protein|nr:hypothetical protein [Candidatus Eisenbacteria bacterium]
MKKVSGFLAFLFAFVLMTPALATAEESAAGEAVTDEPVSMAVVDEMAPVKDAWTWASTANPALAAKLEKIVNGDKTDATATLNEASAATAEANPDLSAKLSDLAAAWTPKA